MSQPLGHKSTAIIVMLSGGTENQVRIQDLVKGGPRPKFADIVKRSRMSEVSNLWPGSRAHLRALEAFGILTAPDRRYCLF